MIISAHQPAYLPWFGYIHKILISDKFILLDEVQFEKNSFINRNYIMSKNGPILLTVPLKLKDHLQKRIVDIEISGHIKWQKKHFNSIYLNYKKSSYFKNHISFFEELYEKEWTYINELNNEILLYILKCLNIRTQIIKMSELSIEGKKNELIINCCKSLGAKKFIFGENGKEYADLKSAKKNKINYLFQIFDSENCYSYRKMKPDKNLSILDPLFNLDNNRIKDLLISSGNAKE